MVKDQSAGATEQVQPLTGPNSYTLSFGAIRPIKATDNHKDKWEYKSKAGKRENNIQAVREHTSGNGRWGGIESRAVEL